MRTGVSMQLDCRPVRFVSRGRGRSAVEIDVVAVRKLLRTDLSIEAIAEHIGVSRGPLIRFIKKRHICDLAERRLFLSRQASAV